MNQKVSFARQEIQKFISVLSLIINLLFEDFYPSHRYIFEVFKFINKIKYFK